MNKSVNKTELVDAVAQAADLPKASAAKAVDATLNLITESLKAGKQVTLIGFGTFVVRERKARPGRNPQTGEPIEIAASKTPTFKAGKALKDAIRGDGDVVDDDDDVD
ncbi:MAG: HU family DNA-binding protein [Candidatus Competibacterales bacterium]